MICSLVLILNSSIWSASLLDDAKKEQYGSGSFFDKNTGVDHSKNSRTFEFDFRGPLFP